MKPLLLHPNLISYVIAGGSLLPIFLDIPFQENSGASQLWIASTVRSELGKNKEGLSKLAEEQGSIYLKDLLDSNPEEYLGKAHADLWGSNPGLLIKLLNSKDRLLVQVHPDKRRAKKYFNSAFGKTEAWYVLDSKKDARVYAGFLPGVTKEVLRKAIEIQDSEAILSLLHSYPIQKGDILFIPAGLPHALGKDSLIIEIQEPTDITLRAERRRPSGELLPETMLHAGLGMEVLLDCFDYECMDYKATQEKYFLKPRLFHQEDTWREETLISYKTTPCFAMHSISLGSGSSYLKRNEAFTIGLVLSGSGSLVGEGFTIPLGQGSEFFIPHKVKDYNYLANTEMKIIECYPPLSQLEEL
ncbi:hypothetical protein MASR2M78_19150 [Treponema sp.]